MCYNLLYFKQKQWVFMSLLAVREQSLNSQFPSHLFGNVELLMLKKLLIKLTAQKK